MSTRAEQIHAQFLAFNGEPSARFRGHIMCPAELKMLIEFFDKQNAVKPKQNEHHSPALHPPLQYRRGAP